MDVIDRFNLLNPDTFRDGHPHAMYDHIRATTPVYRNEGADHIAPFWVLTRYDDIRAVSLDGENFTSTKGIRADSAGRAAMDPEIGQALRHFMLMMDNPEHNGFRNAISGTFMPRALAPLRERILASVETLMDSMADRDTVEFVTEIGAIVPIRTICTIMGVPQEDEWRVFEFTNAIFGNDDPEFAPNLALANERYLAIFDYALDLLRKRRDDPRDDLSTIIALGEVDGRPMTEMEQKSMFSNLIAAGNETTRSSLAGSLWALAQFPDQRKKLVDNPDLIPGAVNELLRWYGPAYQMARTAKQDVEVGGTTIAEGEMVALLYGGGNHDPSVFDDPHRLDVQRANANRHLTFGYGIHHCLGSRLAHMQIGAMLDAFLRRFPDYSIEGQPRLLRSNFVCAIKEMKINLRG